MIHAPRHWLHVMARVITWGIDRNPNAKGEEADTVLRCDAYDAKVKFVEIQIPAENWFSQGQGLEAYIIHTGELHIVQASGKVYKSTGIQNGKNVWVEVPGAIVVPPKCRYQVGAETPMDMDVVEGGSVKLLI